MQNQDANTLKIAQFVQLKFKLNFYTNILAGYDI